jgi:hypothetical protein
MNSPLTFRDIKNLFKYVENDKIVIWELFYRPKQAWFGKIKYADKKGNNMEFDSGLIVTILNSNNQYYQIVTTAFKLPCKDLHKMVIDPMFIVNDLNMTWLNFLIFKKTPMNIIKGWFFDSDEHAEVTVTHVYNRKQNEQWKDLYSTFKDKNSIIPIDTAIITDLKGYEQLSSINSMYNMPDITMVIRNIESISI